MNDLTALFPHIGPIDDMGYDLVCRVQGALMSMPQVDIQTHHVLHGGMYARTIVVPAGTTIAGAFIRVPTILIIKGHATVLANGATYEIDGSFTIPASGGRKQVFEAHTDTELTMLFATRATTVEEAEAQFTNEPELLLSRLPNAVNLVTITGE